MLRYDIDNCVIYIVETNANYEEYAEAMKVVDDILYYTTNVRIEMGEDEEVLCIDIGYDLPSPCYAKIIFGDEEEFNLIKSLISQSKSRLCGFYKGRFYNRRCSIETTKTGYKIKYTDKTKFLVVSLADFIAKKKIGECNFYRKNSNLYLNIHSHSKIIPELIVNLFC